MCGPLADSYDLCEPVWDEPQPEPDRLEIVDAEREERAARWTDDRPRTGTRNRSESVDNERAKRSAQWASKRSKTERTNRSDSVDYEQEQRNLANHRSKLEYRQRLERTLTERRLQRAMTESRSEKETYGINPELRTSRLGNELRRNRLTRGYTIQPASEFNRYDKEIEKEPKIQAASRLERELQLPPLGQEFNRLRMMREMKKQEKKKRESEHVPCGECDGPCERCQRRCCGDCQHQEGGHQHFHWSTHHMTSVDCEEHSPLAHHHRRSRPRVNSAIFVSNDTSGFAGFDAGDFLRRYGSQSKLCRKARSADNIPLTTMEEGSTERLSRGDTSPAEVTHHFGLPILSVSGPSPPDDDFEQIDEYL